MSFIAVCVMSFQNFQFYSFLIVLRTNIRKNQASNSYSSQLDSPQKDKRLIEDLLFGNTQFPIFFLLYLDDFLHFLLNFLLTFLKCFSSFFSISELLLMFFTLFNALQRYFQ